MNESMVLGWCFVAVFGLMALWGVLLTIWHIIEEIRFDRWDKQSQAWIDNTLSRPTASEELEKLKEMIND